MTVLLAPTIRSSSAHEFHTRHKRRLEKFAVAAAKHLDNVHERERAAEFAALVAFFFASLPKPLAVAAAPAAAEMEADAQGPSIATIQCVVADRFRVTVVDMVSARRTAEVILPRQVAMYLAKTLTLRTYPEIGRRFGGRDHTTIIYAVRKVERLIAGDAVLAGHVAALKTSLTPSH